VRGFVEDAFHRVHGELDDLLSLGLFQLCCLALGNLIVLFGDPLLDERFRARLVGFADVAWGVRAPGFEELDLRYQRE